MKKILILTAALLAGIASSVSAQVKPEFKAFEMRGIHPKYYKIQHGEFNEGSQQNVIDITYDSKGNIKNVKMTGKGAIELKYSPNGNLTEAIEKRDDDSQGRINRYEYDSQNRLVKETTDNVVKNTYQWNGLTQITFDRDGKKEKEITYSDNTYSKKVKEVDLGYGKTTYTYDLNGNMLSYESDYGDDIITKVTFEYKDNKCYKTDNEGNVTIQSEFYPDGKYDKIAKSYDSDGKVEKENVYDNSGRVIKEIRFGKTIEYIWNDNVITSKDGKIKFVMLKE